MQGAPSDPFNPNLYVQKKDLEIGDLILQNLMDFTPRKPKYGTSEKLADGSVKYTPGKQMDIIEAAFNRNVPKE